jgi:DME family drug/metabolite transporter
MNGRWYVLMAAVMWGTTGTAQAFAPPGATPTAVGAVRLAIGGLALLLLAIARGHLPRLGQWATAATAAAAGSMAAYQLFFFTAVARTGVAIGTTVAIGSAPLLAGALAGIIYGQKPGRRWLVATLLAIIGCGLLVTAGRRIQVDLVGIILALGAGLTYAVSSLASKRLLDKNPPDAAMAVVFSLGAILLLPVLLVADLSWLAQPNGVAVVLHLGLVATALAYFLYARGLNTIPVAAAVSLALAEPLTAGMLGILWLGEQLSLAAGIGLILAGLALLSTNKAADW